mgnify:FL=1
MYKMVDYNKSTNYDIYNNLIKTHGRTGGPGSVISRFLNFDLDFLNDDHFNSN